MKSAYDSIVWVEDRKGETHICYINETHDNDIKQFESLSDEEKKHCYSTKFPWS
ncbi:MAG: hypothetical protein ABIJ31_04545 [Pseudomonadota bacterium]